MAQPAHVPAPGFLRRAVATVLDRSLLLIAGAIAGLAWVNLAPASYDRLSQLLHFAVNEVGMVFFFGLATKEIMDAMRPGGVLSSTRAAAVPLVSAVGGMVVPAGIYLVFALGLARRDLLAGWAIPCATDIAFSHMAVRAIFRRSHPAIPFLLFLAIADDALGLLILVLAYPAGRVSMVAFASWLAPGLAVLWLLRRRRIASFWPYLAVGGILSWLGFYLGGLHPALALVAVVPFMPGAGRSPTSPMHRDTLNAFERWWKAPVQGILFFFGLLNAGVRLSGAGAGTWIVLTALLVGKPAGIALTALLAPRTGLPKLAGMAPRDFLVVGLAAGVGFTVSLFFATSAFPGGPLLEQTKMGALLSLAAAPLALLAARALRARPGGR